jgi:hypothetical protein
VYPEKFIQIAASMIGLFALDESGVVWWWNHEKNRWESLPINRI